MAQEPELPLIPSVSDVVGTAKARLVEVRPAAAPHVEKGLYGLVFVGLRGQFEVARARLAEEARATRLGSSAGEALTEVAASNYDTPRATEGATTGFGLVTLARSVVHYLPSAALTVSAANATNEASLLTLLSSIFNAFNGHAASVYASGTGAGAHAVAETEILNAPATANMGQIVATLNGYKAIVNDHFLRAATNFQILSGLPARPHGTADAASVVTANDAFASASGSAFSAQTPSSQTSALILANAIKAALLKHFGLRALAGTILRGARFRVEADPVAVPPITGGEYEVVQDAYVRCGAATASARVRATTPGPAQNLPEFSPPRELALRALAPLFDAKEKLRFAPTGLTCAGGTNGQPDRLLRAAAAASWQGAYGPTDQAIIAGSLRFPGLASCPILKDTDTGTSHLYGVDETWSQSVPWQEGLEQYMRDEWAGVGCRVGRGRVINRVVRLEASIVVRRRADLSDTSAITDALLAAARRYFQERPDWWIWRLSALRAQLTRAHPKILKCPTLVVLDGQGVPLTEPAQPTAGSAMTHWWFADGLELVFDAPTA